ncbi:hypothetical protein BD413DRAFT_165017 [Trametes elegans]|nr:hypothetical protein BD413DRAFT_165017 [Trametes elegans]
MAPYASRNTLPKKCCALRNALYKDVWGPPYKFPSLSAKLTVLEEIKKLDLPGAAFYTATSKRHLSWCSAREAAIRVAGGKEKKAIATSAPVHTLNVTVTQTDTALEDRIRTLFVQASMPDPPFSMLCSWADATSVPVGTVADILRKLQGAPSQHEHTAADNPDVLEGGTWQTNPAGSAEEQEFQWEGYPTPGTIDFPSPSAYDPGAFREEDFGHTNISQAALESAPEYPRVFIPDGTM